MTILKILFAVAFASSISWLKVNDGYKKNCRTNFTNICLIDKDGNDDSVQFCLQNSALRLLILTSTIGLVVSVSQLLNSTMRCLDGRMIFDIVCYIMAFVFVIDTEPCKCCNYDNGRLGV